jgi:hypothetical protein
VPSELHYIGGDHDDDKYLSQYDNEDGSQDRSHDHQCVKEDLSGHAR